MKTRHPSPLFWCDSVVELYSLVIVAIESLSYSVELFLDSLKTISLCTKKIVVALAWF